MKRCLFALFVIAVVAWCPVDGQTARDTAHARVSRAAVDTIRRTYPNTLNAAPTLRRMVNRIAAAESLLVKAAVVPVPVPVPPPPPPAPVASFTASCALVQCAFNAGASTGSRLTYSWNCDANPNCAPGSVPSFSFQYADGGQRNVVLTVTDSLGRTASAAKVVLVPGLPVDTVIPPLPPPPVPPPLPPDTGTIAARAELPRSTPNPTFATPTRTVNVSQVMDLQSALNAAQPGDQLILSGTFVGNFVLPSRPCGAGITITSSGAVPPAGTRVTPALATTFAKIVTPNSAPALKTTNPTCGWRIVGVEFTSTLAPTSIQYGLVALGDGGWLGGGDTQTALNKVPQQIVLERVYIHGTPTLNGQRCLALNSAATVVRDSWISECHVIGFQGQAIAVWNSPGPLLIENNHIAGGTQNILVGGADPGIAGLIPSDITVRRNHVWKDPLWKGVYGVGALIETKNVQRLLVESNVMENSWSSAQSGMAIMFKSQTGNETGTQLWQGSTDITFRYNIVRNAQRGLNPQAVGEGGSDRHVARLTVEHNLFTGIGLSNGVQPTDGWLMLLTHDLADVLITNNTFIGNAPGYGLVLYLAYGNGTARRIGVTNNVLAGQSYYAIGSDNGNHAQALTNYAGASWRFTGNCVSQVDQQFWALNPPGNVYAVAVSQLGLLPDGSLSTTSPCRTLGAGADIPGILQRTQGVVVAP